MNEDVIEETEDAEQCEEVEQTEVEVTLPEEVNVGVSPVVLRDAIFKRMIGCLSGKEGLDTLSLVMDQVHFVPEIEPLRGPVKSKSLYFVSALSKCAKDKRNRELKERDDEIFNFMGFKCDQCGKNISVLSLSHLGRVCSCGGQFRAVYVEVLKKLIREYHLDPSPEAVLMFDAHDRLGEAYVDMFKMFRYLLIAASKIFGWDGRYFLTNPEMKYYIDQFYMGSMTGNSQIAKEERELLMLIIRANLAYSSLKGAAQAAFLADCDRVFVLGINAVKFGYLYNQLGCSGAEGFYSSSVLEYSPVYNSLNGQIDLERCLIAESAGKRVVTLQKLEVPMYYPFAVLDERYWTQGRLPPQIVLKPITNPDIFTSRSKPPINVIYGPSGSGKTTLIETIWGYSWKRYGGVFFNFLGDASNSLCLASLPAFKNKKMLSVLNYMGVLPQGVPTLTLTFLKKGEEVPYADSSNPPTIYDRIVQVEDYKDWSVEFKVPKNERSYLVNGRGGRMGILDALGEVSAPYGFNEPTGFVNVRNLGRQNDAKKEDYDVQVATLFMRLTEQYRRGHKDFLCRGLVDEAHSMFPAKVISADQFQSAAAGAKVIKEARKEKLILDFATQQPTELVTEVRNTNFNVFFRELPKSSEKDKSQIHAVLESLQLNDPSVKDVVKDLIERGVLSGHFFWFWYNRDRRDIQVVQPSPPFFCIQEPNLSMREVFKAYENLTKQKGKILLKSWRDVPVIKAGGSSFEIKREVRKMKFGPDASGGIIV